MSEIPWGTIIPSISGVLAVFGTVYGVHLTNKVKQTELRQQEQKDEFDQDKQRRDAIVQDVARCESEIKELRGIMKQMMIDQDELHKKYLEECQQHHSTKMALVECQRWLESAERELKATKEDKEKLIAQVDTLKEMLKDFTIPLKDKPL